MGSPQLEFFYFFPFYHSSESNNKKEIYRLSETLNK